MMLAFLGLTLLEFFIFVPLLLLLAWTTSLDRQGRREGYKWVTLIVILFAYMVYSGASAPEGQPSIFSWAFWKDPAPYIAFGKYMGIGVAYALIEMLSQVFHDKQSIRERWLEFIATKEGVRKYLGGTEGINGDGDADAARRAIKDFCSNWNYGRHLVHINMHELERTPQPFVYLERLKDSVFPWIVLWPAYLISLIAGRFLDTIVDGAVKLFHRIATGVTNAIFRNTFSAN